MNLNNLNAPVLNVLTTNYTTRMEMQESLNVLGKCARTANHRGYPTISKCRTVLVHVMKEYWGRSGIEPLTLHPGIRWGERSTSRSGCLTLEKEPPYPFTRGLIGSQSWYGHFGEKKKSPVPVRIRTPDGQACTLGNYTEFKHTKLTEHT